MAEREAVERSRAGFTTKIVLVGDSRARPVSRVATAVHRHDSTAFTAVKDGIPGLPHRPRSATDHLRVSVG
jgi:hypothetical protein